MNTPEGRRKAVETNKKKDPNYYGKIGSKGGKNSSHRPMNDPEFAKKAAKKRWNNKKEEEAKENDSKTDV